VNNNQQTYNRPLLIARGVLFWLWLITSTLIMALPVLIVGAFSRKLGLRLALVWVGINLFGLEHICGLSGKLHGAENIPDHACMVLSKHQSTFETLFIAQQLHDFVYVAKRSLTLIPIFGWAIWVLDFILIDRKSGRSAVKQMVEQSAKHIDQGTNVIVFPEGTRMPVNAPPNYRAGGAVVASRINADVLPIAHNAGEFWPRMGFIKWPGQIDVFVGPPIHSDGKTPDQILAEAQNWIEEKMREITVVDRFPYRGAGQRTNAGNPSSEVSGQRIDQGNGQ